MEIPNQDLIEILIKYNGHFNYDDYTTIINDGIFENEHFFIFNDHVNIESILFFLISKYPEDLIVFKSMRNAIYSTTTSSLYDIIDVDTYPVSRKTPSFMAEI